MTFYREASPQYSIIDSMNDSLRFTTRRCLDVHQGNLCATSTFVDPGGEPARWHYFGEIEGVGWACNAVGGAHELLCYARLFHDSRLAAIATSLLYHALEAGFFQDDGTIRGYRHIPSNRLYYTYLHDDRYDTWICPGANAQIALELLWASDEVDGVLRDRLCERAVKIADWLIAHVPRCANGWYPRRCTPEGEPFTHSADGRKLDTQFDHSGAGAYLLWLWAELSARGLRDCRRELQRAVGVFRDLGGAFGSINHDTYDDHENVAYSVSFRALRLAASLLRDSALFDWALEHCLHGLERFEMSDNRNGVETRGLLYMEDSWDTSYLWENAEAAHAWFEAALDCQNRAYELKGLTILRAAALHHHGEYGFLTEGVDWNNFNHQWQEFDGKRIYIHVGGVVYGDVNFTQPFLNNMHITSPTLYYLERLAARRMDGSKTTLLDCEDNPLATL